MTAPFGEELQHLWRPDVLQRNLETYIENLDDPQQDTIRTELFNIGDRRRVHWFGTSHELWRTKEFITVLPFRFGPGKFACGVTQLDDLVIRLQYVRDENRHAPVRRLGKDLTNKWQIMPLEWLAPEEVYDFNHNFHHLSSEARAH